ncbi:hypothetical protein [Stella sp.]|uniref:hypothetical protein n=1 Tax=Stella sp. TaxID=2912054 RepID=UPI0035B12C1E
MRSNWTRSIWILGATAAIATALAACASHSDLIVAHKNNEVTVRIVGGDAAPSYKAAREACALDRKRAALAGVSAETLKFVCQPF